MTLLGVEAGGDGIETDHHCATLSRGVPGVLHGTKTFLMQNEDGQITETHSISAGLDYPGVGPEHAFLKESGRAEYVSCDDKNALKGLGLLSRVEGIIPALESSHAIHVAVERAKVMEKTETTSLCACRGEGIRTWRRLPRPWECRWEWIDYDFEDLGEKVKV